MNNVIEIRPATITPQIGDPIEYRDDETKQVRRATVMDCNPNSEWLTISDDGAGPEDDADIHQSLVLRVLPFSEYVESPAPAPDLVGGLTLEERFVASIAIANYRRTGRVA